MGFELTGMSLPLREPSSKMSLRHATDRQLTTDQLCEDILDLIFSFLTDDIASLKSSRLVCRRWAASTRRHIFHRIQIGPSYETHHYDLIQYPHCNTVIPNVRRFKACGSPGQIFIGCPLIDALSRHLTHLTLRCLLVASFDLILTIVDNCPNLVSLALLDMKFPRVVPPFRFAGRFLPPTLRRLSLRRVPLYEFLTWLLAHPTFPPITHLDIGTIDDAIIPSLDSYLKRVARSLHHFIMGFGRGGGATLRGCVYSLDDLRSRSKEPFDLAKPGDLFYKTFGIAPCTTVGMMENLTLFQIDGFVDQDIPNESPAEFIAARAYASAPATMIKRVVLGLNISSTSQLCQYNINWGFFDDIFTSAAYTCLEAVEFRNSGRGDMDNIADFISSRLPLLAARGLLDFQKVVSDPGVKYQ